MLAFLTLFVTSFLVAFSGAMMPGPLMTATIGQSLRYGPWTGPKMIAGHAVLETGLIIAIFLGLAPLLKNETFFIVTAIVGGIIMMGMSHSMFRSMPVLELKSSTAPEKPANPYFSGILMSLANPYWIIWWATIGIGYMLNAQKFGFAGIVSFFSGHILGDLVWYSGLSYAFAKGKKFFGRKTYRILVGICAVFLAVFALWLIADGIKKIIYR